METVSTRARPWSQAGSWGPTLTPCPALCADAASSDLHGCPSCHSHSLRRSIHGFRVVCSKHPSCPRESHFGSAMSIFCTRPRDWCSHARGCCPHSEASLPLGCGCPHGSERPSSSPTYDALRWCSAVLLLLCPRLFIAHLVPAPAIACPSMWASAQLSSVFLPLGPQDGVGVGTAHQTRCSLGSRCTGAGWGLGGKSGLRPASHTPLGRQ